MTPFEQYLKESLNNFQPNLSGQESSWSKLESTLRKEKRKKQRQNAGLGAVAVLVFATGFAYFSGNDDDFEQQPANTPSKEIPVVEQKSTDAPVQKPIQKEITEPAVVEEKDNTEYVSPETKSTELTIADTSSTINDDVVEEPIYTNSEKNSEEFIERFEAQLSVVNNRICLGEKWQFSLNTDEPVSVVWHFSNGSTSEEPNPSVGITKPGVYTAYAELTSLVTGKSQRVRLPGKLEVFPKYTYNIVVDELRSDNFERQFNLHVDGEHITHIKWLNDRHIGNDLKLELNNRGVYTYSAEVSDHNGCKTIVEEKIEVKTDNNLLAPNAFTPNNDGVNDDFLPEALNQMPDGKFVMQIMNPANGKILFESRSANRRWDGTNAENGQVMPVGTYLWSVKVFGSQGSKTFSGKISVVD